jgi:hypothetical protein
MRKAAGMIALIVLFGGEAFGAGGLFGQGFPTFWGHRAHAPAGCAGCYDDSPLCPELTKWTWEPSQCKQTGCNDTRIWHRDTIGVQLFPPLPYGNRAGTANPAPAAAAPSGFPR